MSDYIRNLRRLLGNTKIVIPGVRALVIDSAGRLLFGRQRQFGSWSLPHGCVEVGQSVIDALHHEVEEEAGLRVVRAEAFGLYTDPKYSVVYPNGDQVQTFTVAFVVREWTGELRPDGDEIVELRFFSLDELPEPIYPIHLDTIDDFRRSERGFFLR